MKIAMNRKAEQAREQVQIDVIAESFWRAELAAVRTRLGAAASLPDVADDLFIPEMNAIIQSYLSDPGTRCIFASRIADLGGSHARAEMKPVYRQFQRDLVE